MGPKKAEWGEGWEKELGSEVRRRLESKAGNVPCTTARRVTPGNQVWLGETAAPRLVSDAAESRPSSVPTDPNPQTWREPQRGVQKQHPFLPRDSLSHGALFQTLGS